jgi:hypothetical protein
MTAILDNAILERPGLTSGMLEVEVGEVHRRCHQSREHLVKVGGSQAARTQQALFGQRNHFGHVRILGREDRTPFWGLIGQETR